MFICLRTFLGLLEPEDEGDKLLYPYLYQSTLRNNSEDVTSSMAVRTSNLASLHLLSITLQ
jgi:hypothetical protein